jgi:DNA-binding transcriptional LysR family regulator
MDKLSAMRTFVRVMDAGTFTKAADLLGVPKAQVTRLVQALEKDLKTLLLKPNNAACRSDGRWNVVLPASRPHPG